MHYVVLGIDAPPLNDDDADGVPDYVERVGEAADRALAYYERRGFRAPLADEAGPDARPDLYVSRFSPGTLGVAFPAAAAAGGAFAVVSNNLDPSAERSFASVYATVAHELFHLVQFSYFGPRGGAVDPDLDPRGDRLRAGDAGQPASSTTSSPRSSCAAGSRRPQHSITTQSYGAQLLWRRLDAEQPRLLPALFRRLAARPVAGEGRARRRRDLRADRGEAVPAGVPPLRRLGRRRPRATRSSPCSASGAARRAAPASRRSPSTTSAWCCRAAAPTRSPSRFPRGRGAAAATLTYRARERRGGRGRRASGGSRRRSSDGGRTLTFAVPASVRANARLANPLLVVSNGGERPVVYAVSAR